MNGAWERKAREVEDSILDDGIERADPLMVLTIYKLNQILDVETQHRDECTQNGIRVLLTPRVVLTAFAILTVGVVGKDLAVRIVEGALPFI